MTDSTLIERQRRADRIVLVLPADDAEAWLAVGEMMTRQHRRRPVPAEATDRGTVVDIKTATLRGRA